MSDENKAELLPDQNLKAGSDRKNLSNLETQQEDYIDLSKFFSTLNGLKEAEELPSQIEKIKQKIENRCPNDQFIDDLFINERNNSILEALAVMEFHDPATFDHSIDTYLAAKEKMDELGDTLNVSIREELGDIDIFYRTCLLHDIGKVEISPEILTNTMTEPDWEKQFNDCLANEACLFQINHNLTALRGGVINKSGQLTPEQCRSEMNELHLRPKDVLPIKYVLLKENITGINEADLSQSLGLIMAKHEADSEKILSTLGYLPEASLAGSHHGYNEKAQQMLNKYPASLSGLRMSNISGSIIKMSDIMAALNNSRQYHSKLGPDESKILALGEIIDKVAEGKILKNFALLWIGVENNKLKSFRQKWTKRQSRINIKKTGTTETLDEKNLKDQNHINEILNKIDRFLRSEGQLAA